MPAGLVADAIDAARRPRGARGRGVPGSRSRTIRPEPPPALRVNRVLPRGR